MIFIMSSELLSLLQNIASTRLYLPADALLFQRADPVQNIFAVQTGHVYLLRRQHDGTVFILQRAGPGALIAEASLMCKNYHCAAETAAPSVLSVWPRNKVQALVNNDKNAALAYARHLANEVRAARLRAEIASLKKVRDRLDAWLEWHGNKLPPKGSRHHLAQELSITPEALYRELSRRRKLAK